MKVDAEWELDENSLPFVVVILGDTSVEVTREQARYLANSLNACLNGIVQELARWIELEGYGKRKHLVQKEVFRSSLPAICGTKPDKFTGAWRSFYPLTGEPSPHYFCARCLAAYARLEPAA